MQNPGPASPSKVKWADNLNLSEMSRQAIINLWEQRVAPEMTQCRTMCSETEEKINAATDPGSKFVLLERWEYMKAKLQACMCIYV